MKEDELSEVGEGESSEEIECVRQRARWGGTKGRGRAVADPVRSRSTRLLLVSLKLLIFFRNPPPVASASSHTGIERSPGFSTEPSYRSYRRPKREEESGGRGKNQGGERKGKEKLCWALLPHAVGSHSLFSLHYSALCMLCARCFKQGSEEKKRAKERTEPKFG